MLTILIKSMLMQSTPNQDDMRGNNQHLTSASRLTAAEAAARLGVKRQTVYAYVSRGLLSRDVAADGRTSLFDSAEIERLGQRKRSENDGELHTQLSTALTRVDDQGLWIRGHDLVRLVSEGASFTDVANILWDAPAPESTDSRDTESTHSSVTKSRVTETSPIPTGRGSASSSLLDELRIIVAQRSSADPLRHDLSPTSVRAVGRSLVWAMAAGLPVRSSGSDETLEGALWRRLSDESPSRTQLRVLDSALALLVDHGLAASTFAARIAASVRADPYSVVLAGAGVLGGPLHGAASGGVHDLLNDAERRGDAVAAAGAARRRMGSFPGFGHSVYTTQDPRYGALMTQIVDAWGDDRRLVHVYRVRDVIAERSEAIPNVDLALGALTYLANMPEEAGEAIFAIARTVGWLAHAIEEYDERPLRFRPRARYIGRRPS